MNMSGLHVTTPTDTTIVMTRSFNAPRRLVWDAMTKPELMQQWMFMPPGWAWATCEMDVREGGKYRWAWNGPDGKVAMTISGVHKEVDPPQRIVHTERMEMSQCGPVGELLATLELTEKGGVTHMKMTLAFDSKQARDGALASGMEHGMEAGYKNLDSQFAASLGA